MNLWRVTITERNSSQRKDWHYQFAVLAPDADTAKQKAADAHVVDVATARIEAEIDEEGVLKSTTYFTRLAREVR